MLHGCRHIGLRYMLAALAALQGVAFASPQFDLRAAAPLGSAGNAAEYTLSVDDCRDLAEVQVVATGQRLLPADALRDGDSAVGCSFGFRLQGAEFLQPVVRLDFADGSKQDYSESFQSEAVPPSLQLTQLAFDMEEGGQYLTVSFDASDEVDLSYLSITLTGLRASDLRAAGGVVSQAERKAFLRMDEARRVFPRVDGQSSFSLRQRIEPALSAEEIARNALVMIQASAVDASGNQRSFSDVRMTGSSVDEGVRGISVQPGNLLFTDALQSARLIPEVDFEFRGPTPLPGLGHGVNYRSSNPDKVWVSAEGVVYPIQETAGEAVFVYLSYPGLAEISLPVIRSMT